MMRICERTVGLAFNPLVFSPLVHFVGFARILFLA